MRSCQARRAAGPRGKKKKLAKKDMKEYIRDVPDFPIPGIVFKDITPLLQHPAAFKQAVEQLADRVRDRRPQIVVGIESRGFIFAAPVAYLLGAGFVPVRKLGKLPAETVTVEYALEYGVNTVEMHVDAIAPGQRVLVMDDLLATGGTAAGTIELVEQLGGQVVGAAFLVELTALKGRKRIPGHEVISLIQY
ncbi:MAG: adenine phosphoribosyltransferase [Chloroflexi bacterium]|nr:adenine phosphoribosyltransferase [Chloroflexota bacterium]